MAGGQPDPDPGLGLGLHVQGQVYNPWAVANVEAFHYYCCPECEQKYRKKRDFKEHAVCQHPKAKELFDPDNLGVNEVVKEELKVEDSWYDYDLDHEPDLSLRDDNDLANKAKKRPTAKATKKKAFECQQCGSSFLSNLKLIWHFNTEHQNRQSVVCPHCDRDFDTFSSLSGHFKSHGKAKKGPSRSKSAFQCDECTFSTSNARNLRQHVFVRHRKSEHKFKCSQCDDKKFHTSFLLRQHVDIVHKGMNKRHVCEKCGKSFAYKYGYKVGILNIKYSNRFQRFLTVFNGYQCSHRTTTAGQDSVRKMSSVISALAFSKEKWTIYSTTKPNMGATPLIWNTESNSSVRNAQLPIRHM